MASRAEKDDLVVISRPDNENSGQTLRMVVSMSAITSRPVKIENVRALKKIPGMVSLVWTESIC